MSVEESECGWGCNCGAAHDVLRGVAGALISGEEAAGVARALASFGAVCHSWHLVASAPGLWRRALENASPSAKHAGAKWGPGWWREEYILAYAGWRFIKHLAPDEEDIDQDNIQKELHNSIKDRPTSPSNNEDFTFDKEEDRQANSVEEPLQPDNNENRQPIADTSVDHLNGHYEVNNLSEMLNGYQLTPEPPFGRGVSVSHAALSNDGRLLAVAAEDASIAVWERVDKEKERWTELWRVSESRWSSAWSVQWSPDQSLNLLVTGAVRGATRGEAGVRGVGGELRARAGVASPGAVAWCGGEAFLTLEPRLMAPGLSLTLVWMYSTTQRIFDADSEVAAPLFCLYNEANTHYSHIIVMKMPKQENKRKSPLQKLSMEQNHDVFCDVSIKKSSDNDESTETCTLQSGEGLFRPKQYYHMLRKLEIANEVTQHFQVEESVEVEDNSYVIVCAGGTKGKDRGVCSSLRSWRVRRDKKPETEKIGLKERREARARAREQPVEELEFDEAAVKGRCKNPDGEIRLQEAVRGLIVKSGVLWAITGDGATCVSVGSEGVIGDMKLLAQLPLPSHATPPYANTTLYYISPAINDRILVSPCVCGCGRVLSWCLRSLCVCAVLPAPRAPRPPLATLLLPCTGRDSTRMLVLLGSYIYFPRNTRADMAFRLTPRLAPHVLPGLQSLPPGMPPSVLPVLVRSCTSGVCPPDPPAPLCPCPPKCPPPCRYRSPERLRARRVVCCPPSQGQKPPCPPKTTACSLTCANITTAHTMSSPQEYIPPPPPPGATECDKHRDLVSQRLAAALTERRRQYAVDAARTVPAIETPNPTLTVAGMRDCQSATDGNTYLLKHDSGNTTVPLPCGPCRTPPPDTCVELVPDNNCKPQKNPGIDPCAHKPRVLLHIDRSGCGQKPPAGTSHDSTHVSASQQMSSTSSGGNACPPCPPLKKSASQKCKDDSKSSSSEGLTSRIMKTLSLGRSGSATVTSPKCGEEGPPPGPGKARHAGDKSWCESIKPPPKANLRCRPSTLSERLGRRPPAPCVRRKLHMLATLAACGPEAKPSSPKDMAKFAEKIKSDMEKLDKVVQERSQLKDAARGRSVVCEKKKKCEPKPPVTGCFDVQVPPTSSPLRLRLFYDEVCVPVLPHCPSKETPKKAPSSKSFSSSSNKTSTSPPATRSQTDRQETPKQAPSSKSFSSSSNKTSTSPPATRSQTASSPKASSCASAAVKNQKSDSWLSMKSLKQTIAGCVKTEAKSSSDKKSVIKKPSCGPAAVFAKADKGAKDGKDVIKPVCPPPGTSPRCHPGVVPRCPPPPEPPKRDPCDTRPCCDPVKGDPKSKDSNAKKKK